MPHPGARRELGIADRRVRPRLPGPSGCAFGQSRFLHFLLKRHGLRAGRRNTARAHGAAGSAKGHGRRLNCSNAKLTETVTRIALRFPHSSSVHPYYSSATFTNRSTSLFSCVFSKVPRFSLSLSLSPSLPPSGFETAWLSIAGFAPLLFACPELRFGPLHLQGPARTQGVHTKKRGGGVKTQTDRSQVTACVIWVKEPCSGQFGVFKQHV